MKSKPKKETKILRVLPQIGRSHKPSDLSVKALLPGKREAKESKNIYWETRKNRSDKKGSRV